ncbi:MAG: PKD domain-containing protein [Thermoplasmata archaeon]|nr:PKD domain-containing protein [Thermoplasmata archaeon]
MVVVLVVSCPAFAPTHTAALGAAVPPPDRAQLAGIPTSCAGTGSESGCPIPLAHASTVVPLAGADVWTNVTASQRFVPPTLRGASLVYDPVDNYLLLFGGCSTAACPAPAQTWKYAGGTWTSFSPSSAQPPARAYGNLVFDSRDGYVLLFGGWAGPGHYLNDTWGFSAGAWTNLTNVTSAPPARWAASLAYDHLDGYAVLFGGCGSTQCPRNDTWRFQQGSWKNITLPAGANPAARAGASMSWDDNDGYAVLFGGANATGALFNDTWQFVHAKWTLSVLTSTTSPPARMGASFTYYGIDNAAYLYGGNGTGGTINDIWKFAVDHWTNQSAALNALPGPRMTAAGLESTLSWTTTGVKQRLGFFVVVGGTNAGCLTCSRGGYNDTWVFEPVLGTTATVIPSVVEIREPATFSSVTAGGTAPYGYSWQLGDGSTSASASPSHQYLGVAVYTANLTATDAAGVSARSSTTVMVLSGPVVSTRIDPRFTDIGRTVDFNATTTGGTAPLTTRWDFGDGQSFTGGQTTHQFSAEDTYLGNVSVTDAVLGEGVVTFAITVNATVEIAATVPTSAAIIGTNASFAVTPTLGTPPYTADWTFGDGSQAYTLQAVHPYSTTGTFNASLKVSDAVGAERWDNFTVQVVAAPVTHPTGTFLSEWLPWIVLSLVVAAAALGVFVYYRRRRRRRTNVPIAAAAVGEMSWNQDGDEPHSSDSRSSRRARGRR